MLIFLTFRYTKAFGEWKHKMASEPDAASSALKTQGAQSPIEGTRRSKSVRFGADGATERTSSQNHQAILKGQSKRA